MKQILLSSQTLLMPRRRRSIPCQISRMTSRRTVIWVKSADAKFLYVASPENFLNSLTFIEQCLVTRFFLISFLTDFANRYEPICFFFFSFTQRGER